MSAEGISGIESANDRWIFGYGSLVWRPDFDFEERVAGSIRGWRRRFWQGSTDHRGVPGAPGRVVTLEQDEDATCGGVAYRIASPHTESILRRLEIREQGGYAAFEVPCSLVDARSVNALLYVATPSNPNYLGPASADAIAEQILQSTGPSGPNREYVLELESALAELQLPDPHVTEIANAIREQLGAAPLPGEDSARRPEAQ